MEASSAVRKQEKGGISRQRLQEQENRPFLWKEYTFGTRPKKGPDDAAIWTKELLETVPQITS